MGDTALLLTITEAAERVGRSRKWFYEHALPEVQTRWIGGRRYVVTESLDRWARGGDAA